MQEILEYREAVATVCQDLGVERLDVFGSAARSELGPESDVDVLARFDRAPGHMFSRFFSLKERLEQIFHRPVEVVLDDAIENPYFRASVDQTRVNVYGA